MATRVKIFRNPTYKASGPKSFIYALRKYGITPSREITRFYRNDKNKLFMKEKDGSSTEVTAINQQNDAFYLTPVTVGTPGQKMMLNLDTGSADLWIWSTLLSKNIVAQGEQNGNTSFNPELSSTYKPRPGSTWQITYGDQSNAAGIVGTDNVTIGDITVENQGIELANQISEQFIGNAGDGLVGLSFGSINTVQPEPVKTLIENMIDQDDIPDDKSLFTCYLGSVKDAQDPDKGESFFTFGGIDDAVVKASGQEIHWTPVDNSQGFWEYDSVTATINGEEFAMPNNKAMADTGTTLYLANDKFCKAIYSQIPGAKIDQEVGGYVFPANTPTDQLPEVTVDIGGKKFAMEKENLGWAPVDESGTMLFGGIQPRGDSLPFDIMGDTMLIGLYAIFDVGKKRFGCVQRPDPTPAGTGDTAAGTSNGSN